MFEYSKEQLQNLYKQLPENLKQATFSEKIGREIREICDKNGVQDLNLTTEVTQSVGYVFLGLLSPNKVSRFLENNLKLQKEQANKIAVDLIKVIFIPLKKTLDTMYDIKLVVPKIIKKKDNYREKLE